MKKHPLYKGVLRLKAGNRLFRLVALGFQGNQESGRAQACQLQGACGKRGNQEQTGQYDRYSGFIHIDRRK